MSKIEDNNFWQEFAEILLYWFDGNRRILPWRENPTPYRVWVSEIMLQQTRVEAVKLYYDRFLAELPDIGALAQAKEEKLLKLWEGLGYYNRVKNMQQAAQTVMLRYGGKLPEDYETLIELKGIGSYTAGAISSIAYGRKVPAVDGNVLRVMTRNLEYDGDILKDNTKKYFFRLLKEHMPSDRPGDFNQALMELGALVCVPNGKPLCNDCPLYGTCLARRNGTMEEYPVKSGKKPRRIVNMTVYHITDAEGRLLIRRRTAPGLLSGMWELPNMEQGAEPGEKLNVRSVQEMEDKMNVQTGQKTEEKVRIMSTPEDSEADEIIIKQIVKGKHIFSHVEWHMVCVKMQMTSKIGSLRKEVEQNFPGELVWASEEELREKYALPTAFSMWV
ncbi:MAG: A/G-specific adenine glycosylase [Lachnospiraceae bacterium]|nr:A/G-specific adenine glycosylase [Lachnospiraceae bacterium]